MIAKTCGSKDGSGKGLKIKELLESGDFYILLTRFNIDILNKLLPEECEIVYEKGGFWLHLKRK